MPQTVGPSVAQARLFAVDSLKLAPAFTSVRVLAKPLYTGVLLPHVWEFL